MKKVFTASANIMFTTQWRILEICRIAFLGNVYNKQFLQQQFARLVF